MQHALRSIRRRPAFFVIATGSFAAALGICSATFSLTDAVRSIEPSLQV